MKQGLTQGKLLQAQIQEQSETKEPNQRKPRYEDRSYKVMKRIFDIVLASVGLLVLFPVYLIIAILVMVDNGFPIFFKHERVGQHNSRFYVFKFRSMRRDAEKILHENPELLKQYKEGFKITDDPRLLRIGKFIRETSLDELPQLLNVVRGEMSLVGPRPIIEMEIDRYNGIETYFRMKPGCAGIWQCSGRSEVDYETRLAMNQQYYETASIRRDIVILAKTVWSVLKREGAM
ncbi:MAG: sugar transferase [Armatimonadetes bacterium]|nr:sugar transferase [Armatimonadota bacterium]